MQLVSLTEILLGFRPALLAELDEAIVTVNHLALLPSQRQEQLTIRLDELKRRYEGRC